MKVFLAILTTLTWTLLSISGFGQNSQIEGVQFSDELVTISTELIDCISNKNGTAKQYLSIKIENKLQTEVQVKFKKNLWYDGTCTNCESESDEHVVIRKIDAGASDSGNCESSKALKIFVKMLNLKNVRKLTHHELKEIEVTKL